MTLDLAAGILVILQLILSAAVVIVGQNVRLFQRGARLNRETRVVEYMLSVSLLIVVIANCVLIVWRLVKVPADMGNKDELSLTATALGVLWWTDVLRFRPGVRRRHKVANLLACFPTFRYGNAGQGSPTSDLYRSCEFVIRSAHWKLRCEAAQKNRPVRYWRGIVARSYDSERARDNAGGAIVVLFDETAQDEAGADLLTPKFTHTQSLDKRYMANVVWNTLQRSNIWNIDRWNSGFSKSIRRELEDSSAVIGMLRGELGRYVTQNALYHDNNDDTNELSRLIWAKVMLEVLDYLAHGTPMNLLMAFVDAPFSVNDALWDSVLLSKVVHRMR